MARKRLGELLLEQGAIDGQQLYQALVLQRQSGNRLGAALVSMGVLTEEKLVKALAVALGLEVVNLDQLEVDWTALHTLRDRFCDANDLFPVALETAKSGKKVLTVAMADPLNLPAQEEIEFTTGVKVQPRIATLSQVRAAIRKYYLRLPPEEQPAPKPAAAEEVVLTDAVLEEPRAPQRRAELELELPEQTKPVPPPDRVVTGRTALAELIREREEQVKSRARPPSSGAPGVVEDDLAYLVGEPMHGLDPYEQIDRLERRLWALMRVMAKKGLLTREEFLEEFDE